VADQPTVSKSKPQLYVSGRDILIWVVAPLLFTTLSDHLTQHLAAGMDQAAFLGLIGFVPDRIHTYFLGTVSGIPSTLVNTIAVSVACFLSFVFLVLQWAVTTRSLLVRLGLSLFLGAVLGHCATRLAHGHVLSFIAFGSASLHTPTFNLGDLYLLLGTAMVVAGSWRETGTIWPYRDVRSSFTFWVNPRFQLRHCMTLVLAGLAYATVLGGFGIFFFKGSLEAAGVPAELSLKLTIGWMLTTLILAVSFLTVLFFVGLVQSHRIIGPLYAFERFLEDVFKGKSRKLKLRAGDEFRQLETLAEELDTRLNHPSTRKSA
jgi:signal peptidase II